jgi:multidrug efflux pump subunit AcrA (membrane-fusion protein)
MEFCVVELVIHPAPLPPLESNGKLTPPGPRRRRAPPVWRRPRIVLAILGLLLVGVVAVVKLATPTVPPAAPVPTNVALLAHGQIVPARQARVGTQAGGILQQLSLGVGSPVSAQTPLAWVRGPSATEVVTAPFSGTLTNVLVHEGDTLAPAAPIAVVADLRTLHVETTDVDEFLIAHVSIGQVIQISVDALDNQLLEGRVSSVAMLPEPSSTSSNATDYPVTISLESVPPQVHAGMSVRVTFPN